MRIKSIEARKRVQAMVSAATTLVVSRVTATVKQTILVIEDRQSLNGEEIQQIADAFCCLSLRDVEVRPRSDTSLLVVVDGVTPEVV